MSNNVESEYARQEVRQKYLRAYLSPFRATQTVTDPAALRFESARAYAREYYKLTPRAVIAPLIVVGIVVGFQVLINGDRKERERKAASSETTYFERAVYKTKVLY